jgi:hypothetical protein
MMDAQIPDHSHNSEPHPAPNAEPKPDRVLQTGTGLPPEMVANSRLSQIFDGAEVETFEEGRLHVVHRGEPSCAEVLREMLETCGPGGSLDSTGSIRQLSPRIRKYADSLIGAEGGKLWHTDMMSALNRFAEYSGSTKFKVSIQKPIPTFREPDFPGEGLHLDRSENRMIVWYESPSFEWVESKFVDQEQFDRYMRTHSDTGFLSSEAELHSLPRNAIAFFNGAELYHRAAFAAQFRLLFVVDAL